MSSGCATRAIAQMKPTISRAIAVVTTTFGLPIATRRRYRAHNRTCAFQAMSLIAAGRHAIGPGALDQDATRKRIACLGNSGTPDGASGRVLARHQSEISH